MIDDKQLFILFLILIIILLGFLIKKCKDKENNTNENFSLQLPFHHKNQEVNHYNRKKPVSEKLIKPHNQINVSESHPYNIFPKEKNIVECQRKNNQIFRHSKKQKQGPVEYTNTKTHIGPSKNFHQCFNNGDKNIKNDLGWRELELKYKTNQDKYSSSLNPNNNLNNPAGSNYLSNLENLENVYF